jgi:tetratricopeptide (TPR) repeat protein
MTTLDARAAEVPATLRRAVELHRKGDLARARTLYEEILHVQPTHFDALHLSGVIAIQTNDARLAVELISKAIMQYPGSPASHCNKGSALEALREWEAALASYDGAIDLQPNYAEAHYNRGNVLRKLNRCEAALTSYDRAIAIKPDIAQAHFNRGNVLWDLGQFAGACSSFDRAIALNPGYAEAHFNRGRALKALHRWDDAIASYEKAIASGGDRAEAHCNIGNVHKARGRSAAALENYERALAIKADLPEAHFNRGVLLHELGRFEDAIAAYDRAVSCKPDYPEARSNKGNALTELNRLTQASTSYREAIAIKPDYAEAHFNHSIALLLAGEFERGQQEYEWRWRNPGGSVINERRAFPQPLWLGEESPAGKTILLHSEQGLGDTIQFCRYAKPVADLGCKVILEVQPPLIKLLTGLEGVSRLIAKGAELPAFDLQCPLMSLPLALKTTLRSIPSPTRYLFGDDAIVARWRDLLGGLGKPAVGLVWSGNARQRNDHKRSLPLEELIRHLPRGIQYVCLQKDLRELDERTLEQNPQVLNFGQELDFENTAALCECLDLVISVDTSLAHLSAALGRETWVLLPFNPDWRWLLSRADSPWYPTAKLYRQPAIGDWGSVLTRLAAELTCRFLVNPMYVRASGKSAPAESYE